MLVASCAISTASLLLTSAFLPRIRFDHGSDANVTSRELHAAEKVEGDAASRQDAKQRLAHEAFNEFLAADEDADGYLSHGELQQHHTEMADADVKSFHADLDVNQDGRVTGEEFVKHELLHAEL